DRLWLGGAAPSAYPRGIPRYLPVIVHGALLWYYLVVCWEWNSSSRGWFRRWNRGGAAMTVDGLITKEPQSGNDTTDENKRKALEALDSRGSRHDAATAADVSLKTLDDWRWRDDQFAAEWDATIDRVMKRLREQPLDDKGNFKRSPLQYGLK